MALPAESDTLRRLSATNEHLAEALAKFSTGGALQGHAELVRTESDETVQSRRNYLCKRGCHREGGVDKRLIALLGQALVSGVLLTTSIVQIATGAPNQELYYGLIGTVIGLYSPSSKRLQE